MTSGVSCSGGSVSITPTIDHHAAETNVPVVLDGIVPSVATARPPSCSPVDLTASPLKQQVLLDTAENISTIGGPLTRSRKRKLGGGAASKQTSHMHHNMPSTTNTSVTITLQVNSTSFSTSSSTSNNDEDTDPGSVSMAQIVPTNRAAASKLQRRGCFEDVPIAQLGINQHQHPALAMVPSNLSSPSYCGSEVASPRNATSSHASLAVALAATNTGSAGLRVVGAGGGSSDEHIQNMRSAFANMPTSMATAASAGGPGALGCRSNAAAAVTITID